MDAERERQRAYENGWTYIGHADMDGVRFGGEVTVRSISLDLTDDFALLIGRRKLTGGRPIDGGVLFEVSETERVFVAWTGLGFKEKP